LEGEEREEREGEKKEGGRIVKRVYSRETVRWNVCIM